MNALSMSCNHCSTQNSCGEMEVCSGVQPDIFTVPMTTHWKFDATQADQRTAVFSSLAVLHQLALDSPAFQWLVSCPRSPQRSGSGVGGVSVGCRSECRCRRSTPPATEWLSELFLNLGHGRWLKQRSVRAGLRGGGAKRQDRRRRVD